jgi:hypothetical protein
MPEYLQINNSGNALQGAARNQISINTQKAAINIHAARTPGNNSTHLKKLIFQTPR